MFKDKPWKEWKTRKITLVGVVLAWFIYIVIGVLMGWFGHELDTTLTENIFSSGKWLITTGCAITIAKIFKGKSNSDDDEIEGE